MVSSLPPLRLPPRSPSPSENSLVGEAGFLGSGPVGAHMWEHTCVTHLKAGTLGGGSRHTVWVSKPVRYTPADTGMVGLGWEEERSSVRPSQDWVEARSSGHEAGGSSEPTFPSQFPRR